MVDSYTGRRVLQQNSQKYRLLHSPEAVAPSDMTPGWDIKPQYKTLHVIQKLQKSCGLKISLQFLQRPHYYIFTHFRYGKKDESNQNG